jgi:ribose transport system permease protein
LREWLSRYGIALALVALVVALSLLSPTFLATTNLINVLRQISVNALLAFGMTTVILAGGIDLSVGSVLAFSGALAAGFSVAEWPPALAMIVALAVGALLGMFNGMFVGYARLAPSSRHWAGSPSFAERRWSTPTAGRSLACPTPSTSSATA